VDSHPCLVAIVTEAIDQQENSAELPASYSPFADGAAEVLRRVLQIALLQFLSRRTAGQLKPNFLLIYGLRYDRYQAPDANPNAPFIYSRDIGRQAETSRRGWVSRGRYGPSGVAREFGNLLRSSGHQLMVQTR